MKILTAYGKDRLVRGTKSNGHKDHWNWCNDREIVSPNYAVCDNHCSCGCDRSFVGISSTKSTTRAFVVDVPFSDVLKALDTLHKTTLEGWSKEEAIANQAVLTMMLALDSIEKFPEGTIVELSPDGKVRTAI